MKICQFPFHCCIHDPHSSLSRLNHMLFKALQESFTDYATFFSRLALFILRLAVNPLSAYSIPLDSAQTATATNIIRLLSHHTTVYSQFKQPFHRLIHSLLFTTYTQSAPQRLSSPLRSFIIISCLRSDGSWEPPVHITPKLAKLQWGFRVVVFQQILLKLEGQDSLTADEIDR